MHLRGKHGTLTTGAHGTRQSVSALVQPKVAQLKTKAAARQLCVLAAGSCDAAGLSSASVASFSGRTEPLQPGVKPRSRHVCQSTDYIASASDEGVLRLPGRTELDPAQVTNVFGYARNLHEKFHLGRVIGAGSFGVVRECIEQATGRLYAVKTVPKVPKRGLPTPRYLLKLRTEVEIMQQLGYSLDAVNLKDAFEDDEAIHLVMELCEGGALLERIESHKYSEAYIAKILRSILRFISQCHAKGIIYRDVKPDNFLFLTNEEDSPLKATDFGLSIRHWPNEPKLTSRSGTPAYMAPELVLQSYDEKSDLWSVGMLAYQLLTGRFPFWEDVRTHSLSDVWKAILTQEVNWNAQELHQLSPAARSFLQLLLQRAPESRPSASEALQHPFISEAGRAADLPLQGSVVQRLQRFSTYGHLKQVVLKLIVEGDLLPAGTAVAPGAIEGAADTSGLPKPVGKGLQLTNLQDLFTLLDTDASGAISLQELTEGLRRQGYVLADAEVEALMRKVDFDHDGTVSLSEFITTLLDWDQLQSDNRWQSYLDHVYKQLDIDGDGYISLDELIGMLESSRTVKVGPNAAAERLAEAKLMLREADTNGDGRISREEFYSLLRDSHAPDSLSFYDDRLSYDSGPRKSTAAAA